MDHNDDAATDSSAQAAHASPSQENALLTEIRAAILADTKKAGRRLTVDEAREKYAYFGPEALEVIASLADAGILVRPARTQVPSGDFAEGVARLGSSIGSVVQGILHEIERSRPKDPTGAFAAYRQKLLAEAEKSDQTITRSSISFLGINAGMWYINLTRSPGILWASIVTAATASSFVQKILHARGALRKAAEVQALPALSDQDLAEYKSIHRERDALVDAGASFVTLSALMAAINLVMIRGLPILGQSISIPDIAKTLWFPYVMLALGGIFVIKLGKWRASGAGKMKRFFAKFGLKTSTRDLTQASLDRKTSSADLGAYALQYQEAKEAIQGLEAVLADSSAKGLASEDIKADLSRYLGQVRLLAQSANEIEKVIDAIPMAALARDKVSLTARSSAPSISEALKKEYMASIAEIETQQSSLHDLRDQKEVIVLRLRSSVQQLRQMRLDLARAHAADATPDAASAEKALDRIHHRTDELSRYIDDLRQGHIEASKDALADHFAELEAASADVD